MPEPIAVTIIDQGPLKISGASSLRFDGEPQEVSGDLWLCRCGQSKNPPFCDSSHKTAGFQGTSEPREAYPVRTWEGRSVRTHFNPNVCMHAGFCKPLKALREAELAGDEDAGVEILAVVDTCPSGALTWERKTEGAVPDAAVGDVDVEVMAGGEVRIHREFEINAALRERQPSNRGTLCRCGLSKSKPWCDGQHKKRTDFR